MKSGGPWNLRGLHPEARAAAREAARRSGMSVGEWLNTVIQPANEEDEDAWWSATSERAPDDRWQPQSRNHEHARHRDTPSGRHRGHEPDDRWRQSPHNDEVARERHRDRDRHRHDREPDDRWRQSPRYDDGERKPDDQYRLNFRDDWEPELRGDADWRRRGSVEQDDDRPLQRQSRPERERFHQGSPYRAELERPGRPRHEQQRYKHDEEAGGGRAAGDRDVSIDKAVAEIEARQRALDGEASERSSSAPKPQAAASRPERSCAAPNATARSAGAPLDLSGLERQLRQITTEIEALRLDGELGTAFHGLHAEIAAVGRSLTEALPRRALESLESEIKALAQRVDQSRQPSIDGTTAFADSEHGSAERRRALSGESLVGFEEEFKALAQKVDVIAGRDDPAAALAGVERGLAEVRGALSGLAPAESLVGWDEELKALAQKVDVIAGRDDPAAALAGVERGLAEMQEVLGGLPSAGSLSGFDEGLKALSKKIDAVVGRDDPAALQQLDAAVDALRGIVSHVASNDTLSKVAEDVRTLAAKVDGLAANAPAASALEVRIDRLAGAIDASTAAGHAVPRELEKLLSGLIEKLEWVQLTHTDHSALAHLEDRIATLVKRLDTSDARLGLLEGIERGLADLLIHIEQLRGKGEAAERGAAAPVAIEAIGQKVAEITQTERHTQDSLEDMHGTMEHVVDRLAMIESEIRSDKAMPAAAEPSLMPIDAMQALPEDPPHAASMPVETARIEAGPNWQRPLQSEPAPPAPAPARKPIDPDLPPDHPLDPGSAAGRSRHQPSPGERVAASEAAVGSKPPVIPDPGGGKHDFIAAARRAAQAAAAASAADQSGAKSGAKSGAEVAAQARKLTERLRTIVVAVAVVAIVVGGIHIISRLFVDGGPSALPHTQSQPHILKAPLPLPSEPGVQTEPMPAPIQPPHVQIESPPPAAASSAENSRALPAANPGADPAQHPLPPNPPTGASPGQQSLLYGDTVRTLSDITGSLPSPMVQNAPTAPLAPAPVADNLPIAIGGPALRAAALAGDPSAAYQVATRFADGRVVPASDEQAAHWFDVAAKKGFAPAQFRLGTLYEKGLGVRKNLAMARDLYRAAAEKGYGKAMHNLAVLYAEGVDGKADYRLAAQWFRKAADRGITDSQYNLAVLYARGVGVEQSFAESYKWFFLAAKDGDEDAAQKRDEMAAHLDQQALEAARVAAEKWSPLPQPANATTVKGAWDPPAKGAHVARSNARLVKAPLPIASAGD